MDYARSDDVMMNGPPRNLDADRRARAGVQAAARRSLEGTARDVAVLRRLSTVRARCQALLTLARRGASESFLVDDSRLEHVVERVAAVLRAQSRAPGAPHGRMRHFDAGGRPRSAELSSRLGRLCREERARALIDLIVPSVLLDAGAGDRWSYDDAGARLARSEGLAVASLRMFLAGGLASDGHSPRTDAEGLSRITPGRLATWLQVSGSNPIVGLEGRAHLLSELGRTLSRDPERFGREGRPGQLFDWARARADASGALPAEELLETLLDGLSPIWPGRFSMAGHNLGDVWPHPALGPGASGLVPLHKLTQWLAISLVEPLAEGGVEVTGLSALTPLSDYRNGGLLLDLGVLTLRDERDRARVHAASDPLVVEWRALTVALLDELGRLTRDPIARAPRAALEAATWRAGRLLAEERRPGAAPPLLVESDGTVF